MPVSAYKFAEFELDYVRFQLRRDGRVVKLERIPMELLILLAEKDGNVVTRPEIVDRLWGKDVFVDTEHGINTAISKIRRVLRDDPERPRFVHTVSGKGYRFVAPTTEVKPHNGNGSRNLDSSVVDAPSRSETRPWLKIMAWTVAGVICMLASFAYLQQRRPHFESVSVTPAPFTALPGLEVVPTFSPDGSQIAFAWSGDPASNSGFDLYAKAIGSENLIQLTHHPSDWISPAWSPDGARIAFHRVSGPDTGIYEVPALGGAERRLRSTRASDRASEISWSPDSKWIAFADSPAPGGHYTLSLLSTETLQSKPIHHTETCQEEVSPAFSRDGKRLAFVCHMEFGGFGLYTVTLPDGDPQRLGQYAGWPDGIAWTADSNRLVGSRHVEGTDNNELYEVTVSDGQLRAFQFGESGEHPTISAKGDKLAYEVLRSRGINIWRRDLLHPRTEAVKVIASTRESVLPQYSPDGKYIAFASKRSGNNEIWMSSADGTGLVQVSKLHNPQTGTPHWSPDSKKIVFDSRHDGHQGVYVVDIAERVPRKLATNLADASQPSWSRDGKSIYFIAGGSPGRIYRCAPDGGGAVALSTGNGSFPQESFDGETVYFAAN